MGYFFFACLSNELPRYQPHEVRMKLLQTLFAFCIIACVVIINGCSKDATPTEPTDTQAPSISITQPTDNQEITTSLMRVTMNASDDKGVAQVEIIIDGTVVATLTAEPWSTQISLSSFTQGNHSLQAKAYDAAGNSTTSSSVTFKKGATTSTVARIVLSEMFTNAGCPPCGPAEEYYEGRLVKDALTKSRVITVRYHVWWPYAGDILYLALKSELTAKVGYYKVNSVPWLFFNGKIDCGYDWYKDNSYPWASFLGQAVNTPPDASIDLKKTLNGNTITVDATIKGLTQAKYSDLRYFLYITESGINYNGGNTVFVHNNVVRTMATGSLGELITITQDQVTTVSKQITLNPSWDASKLEIVAFVQSAGSKYVLQAARLSVQ